MTAWDWLKENAAAIGIVLTVVGGIGGTGYSLGLKQGENNAKEVEEFRKTLPPMMENLKALAGELAKNSAMSNENIQLKADAEQSKAKLSELEGKNNVLAASLKKEDGELADLRQQVAKFFPTESVSVTIQQHNAPEVVKGLLRLGLDSVFPSNSFVSVKIIGNDKGYSGSMNLNDPKEVTVVGGSCTVTVAAINYPSADFVIRCNLKSK